MESSYGIGVKNRYELFYDDEEDPTELLRQQEEEKERRKAEKSTAKDKIGKGPAGAPVKGVKAPVNAAGKKQAKEAPVSKSQERTIAPRDGECLSPSRPSALFLAHPPPPFAVGLSSRRPRNVRCALAAHPARRGEDGPLCRVRRFVVATGPARPRAIVGPTTLPKLGLPSPNMAMCIGASHNWVSAVTHASALRLASRARRAINRAVGVVRAVLHCRWRTSSSSRRVFFFCFLVGCLCCPPAISTGRL